MTRQPAARPGRRRAVHQFVPALIPRDATGQPHPAPAPGAARRRLALGDLRRGHPRRAARREHPGGALPRRGPRPATSSSTSSRRRRWWPTSCSRAARAAGARLPQRHPSRALRAAGTRHRPAGRPRPWSSWRCLAPRAALGPGRQRRSTRPTWWPPAAGAPPWSRCWWTSTAWSPRPTRRVAARLAAAKADGGADWLFVGRLVPSKAQHDLVKALWAYRRLYDPAARLHLVGSTPSRRYLAALRGLRATTSGCAEAVRITGEVSDAALAAHFGAGRRLRLALGPRGLRRAAARGHAGRGAGGGPARRGRAGHRGRRRGWCSTAPSRPTWPAAVHRVLTDAGLREPAGRRRPAPGGRARPGRAGAPGRRGHRPRWPGRRRAGRPPRRRPAGAVR